MPGNVQGLGSSLQGKMCSQLGHRALKSPCIVLSGQEKKQGGQVDFEILVKGP
jgi:hypothetical protein